MSSPAPYRLALVPTGTVASPLLAHARNVTSQFGEDGILEHLVRVLPIAHRYAVEFGAWDGRHLSNTRNLIENHGWRGCLIEGSAPRHEVLRDTYAQRPDVTCLHRTVEPDGPQSLDALLPAAGAPTEFGLLSVDVDGMDYFIWEGLSRYRPAIVVIEFNPTVPNDVEFVQAKDPTLNQGCSLRALVQLGIQKGYALACATVCNAVFVTADRFPALEIDDNRPETLYRPGMDGRIFHGYDGYVHTVGMDRLGWISHPPLTSDDFQVLPPERRQFHG